MTDTPPSLLAEQRALLDKYNLAALKRFGQNFLIDRRVLDKIIDAAAIQSSDVVVEVGPGLGVLTRELAAQAGRLIAVEVDRGMVEILRREFVAMPHVTIIEADILQIDVKSLSGGRPYKVVANLPYNITSPVLRHFLEASNPPAAMVVTVQKEVARQITAVPGDMSLLSVAVQFYARARIAAYISPEAFYPVPKVSSAILRLDVLAAPPLDRVQSIGFFRLVRAAFAARRKQLINTVSAGLVLGKDVSAGALNQAGIDPKRRAETLSMEEWLRLFYELKPCLS